MRSVGILVAVLLACSAAGSNADAPLPDSATIRARIQEAAGPRPSAFHETDEVVSSDGLTSVEHDYVRDNDWREVFDEGPFHSERGETKGQRWHQNANGQTVLDNPDPGLATKELITTTVQRVHVPLEAYVIATLNAGGDGEKQYVDPTTWRTVRREDVDPNGTRTTTYDDFRADHGRTFAHHWHVDNGITRTTSDTRIVSYDHDPVAADEVAIAQPARQLVTFPPGVTSVTLPTTFTHSDIIVRATINGRGLDFVLDTGASGILLDAGVAKQLGLTLYAPHSAVTAQRYTIARTVVPEMDVGPLVMRNVAVLVAPHAWDEADGVKAVGLMGFDFLAELGLTLDYEHQRVTAVPGALYVPPHDPLTTPLDVRVGDGNLETSASINGALGERWALDTGADATFLIFDYFARRHPEALKDAGGWGRRSDPVYFAGVGGQFDTRPYAIANLQLSTLSFRDFIGYRVISKGSYDESDDGLIGSRFLRMFTVGIDYMESRVYLTPTAPTRRTETLRKP